MNGRRRAERNARKLRSHADYVQALRAGTLLPCPHCNRGTIRVLHSERRTLHSVPTCPTFHAESQTLGATVDPGRYDADGRPLAKA